MARPPRELRPYGLSGRVLAAKVIIFPWNSVYAVLKNVKKKDAKRRQRAQEGHFTRKWVGKVGANGAGRYHKCQPSPKTSYNRPVS
jgi:hypothetical protein